MSHLATIRETRAAKVAEMRQMLNAAQSEKRSLNPQEQSAFDSLKATITDLEGLGLTRFHGHIWALGFRPCVCRTFG